MRSVRARQTDPKRESTHQDEADGPGRIKIEPTPRYEFETQVAVDQPRAASACCDHRHRVGDGDHDGHTEIGFDERACCLMASVEIGAEPEINRHEHQPRTMSDRHGEGPEPQLRRSYPRQPPRMAPAYEPEDT